MADFPAPSLPAPPILTPFHPDSIGSANQILNNSSAAAAASATWAAANTGFFYPFTLTQFATAYKLLFYVGATSSGNIDMGIYDSQFNRIVSMGSTAMSASTNAVQALDITDTLLSPGDYFLAVACDNTTGTCFRIAVSADEVALSSFPIYQKGSLTGPTLPNPVTVVTTTQGTPPIYFVGIQFRSAP